DRDDVGVHLDRVRHEDEVVIKAWQALDDAGLAVSTGAIDKQWPAGSQRRPELIDDLAAEHQIREGFPQLRLGGPDFSTLVANYLGILFQRDWRRTRITARFR